MSALAHRLIVVVIFISLHIEVNGIDECRERNETEAAAIGRICRAACSPDNGTTCGTRRTCICDHECGYACVYPGVVCEDPPSIDFQESLQVIREVSPEKTEIASPPYMYNDMAVYSCQPGFVKESNVVFHYCNSRKEWTGRAICKADCRESSYDNADSSILCGEGCYSDSDCSHQGKCRCNGHCGLTCTNPLFSTWFPIKPCSVTCGGGTTTEIRRCLSPGYCFGPKIIEVTCNTHSCPSNWRVWEGWSGCSQTCGTGIQNRTRTCSGNNCAGAATEKQECSTQICPAWSDWRQGSCSVTCGGGTRRLTRTCSNGPCPGSSILSVSCIGSSCPTWSEWQQQGDCSRSCGGGTLRLTRSCNGGSTCSGLTTSNPYCNTVSCPGNWRGWGAWTGCSQTCGTGIQSRTRTCSGTNCPCASTEKQECSTQLCPAWSDWRQGSCSVTCGGGTRRLTRTCSNGPCPGLSSSSVSCNTNICPTWSEWQQQGDCSRSCGGGTLRLTRSCNGGSTCSGSATFNANCNTVSCPGNWRGWGAWTRCSQTCGTGIQSRTRTCSGTNCPCASTEKQECSTQLCPAWSDWRQGSCSVTCGGGTTPLTRTCSNGPCPGSSSSSVSCNTNICPTWGVWRRHGDCSRSCGGGTLPLRRTCSNGVCPGSSYFNVPCNTGIICPRGWSTWGSWGSCANRVTRTRSRICQSCPGSRSGSSACPVLGAWSGWGSWSGCSATCGFSLQTRTRRCLSSPCTGSTTSTQQCNVPDRCCSPRSGIFCPDQEV